MDLEKQVPNMELCKKLKEYGWPQRGSLFYWDALVPRLGPRYGWPEGCGEDHPDIFAAPTVADLGDAINGNIKLPSKSEPSRKWYWSVHIPDSGLGRTYSNARSTEADARAEMWLWLKSNVPAR